MFYLKLKRVKLIYVFCFDTSEYGEEMEIEMEMGMEIGIGRGGKQAVASEKVSWCYSSFQRNPKARFFLTVS